MPRARAARGPKPCAKCPWYSKDKRDKDAVAQPEMQAAMQRGDWFCCHVNMVTCYGALRRHTAYVNKQAEARVKS